MKYILFFLLSINAFAEISDEVRKIKYNVDQLELKIITLHFCDTYNEKEYERLYKTVLKIRETLNEVVNEKRLLNKSEVQN